MLAWIPNWGEVNAIKCVNGKMDILDGGLDDIVSLLY